MRRLVFALSVLALALYGGVASAGEYHVGQTLLCYDCHTMHFSMQHGWTGATPVGNTPVVGGDWLGTGPNNYLLKAPVNEICLECHDGRTFAPDVLEANDSGSNPASGREAGALNEHNTLPYQDWKGHTLGATVNPPGWDSSAAVGNSTPVYTPSQGLECINCHTQHGRATAYRNLGPRRIGGVDYIVSYAIQASGISSTADVTIQVDKASLGTFGDGNLTTRDPYYGSANIFFNRIDGVKGTVSYANKISVLCAACHGDFHDDADVNGTGGAFKRHPNAGVDIGALGGGHSSLSRFVGKGNKVKVATADYTAYTETSPICMSCHKAHGNQNPFGLVFMGGTGTITEEGTGTDFAVGHRDLCGQCHGQGN